MTPEQEFLAIDFAQSYEQLRQYNESIRRVFEFAFAGIVAVSSAAAVLIEKYSHPAVFWFVSGLLLSSSSAALLLYFSYARNRVYFVVVARFVNEIRANYLKSNPLDCRNNSGMWADPHSPPFLDLFSSQIIEASICVFLYGLAFGAGVALAWPLVLGDRGHDYRIFPGAVGVVLYVGSILTLLFVYLSQQDKKAKPTKRQQS